ncbi:transposase [Candidatus Defluviicoccus seviourii]|uniref:Transposase n=1 Tax=Candidatus Defluviicoccus seviourii TaxID=2565273 RepID=A0A564WD19_9PROT|nr:transposase [Candidatus Defluviicoccus seviourii]
MRLWLALAPVQALVFAPVQEAVLMGQVHVLTGPERRRRFSLEEKRTIVAAAFARGAVVSDVARRADVCASLIYRWRRELGAAPSGFAEVVLAPIVAASDGDGCGDGHGRGDECGERDCPPARRRVEAWRSDASDAVVPAIEVELAGSSRLRIPASTPPELAAAVIAALRRR